MREIVITMEKTIRISKKFVVSDEDYEGMMTDGICPPTCYNKMQEIIKDRETEMIESNDDLATEADVEYDYQITDDEDKIVVDWD